MEALTMNTQQDHRLMTPKVPSENAVRALILPGLDGSADLCLLYA